MATVTLRPNATGTNTNLTPNGAANNWDCVEEETSDGDSTYVSIDGLNNYDTYIIPNPPASGTINSVTVHVVARATNATPSAGDKVRPSMLTYGSIYWQEYNSPTDSYTEYTYQETTNPDTSAAWAWTEVDALEIGVSLSENRASNELRCTQVWVVVDYTPATFIPKVFIM